MDKSKNVLMVAAENDALPSAKVGGIGDVIRDIPQALAKLGCHVHVVIPSYGFLHELPGAKKAAEFPVAFGVGFQTVALYHIPQQALKSPGVKQVNQWVLHHPGFAPCGPQVYCNDGADKPFATDASKYALFCAAVAQSILRNAYGVLSALHLHDWHAALLAVLRAFDPQYKPLQSVPLVFTIHNLALQGVRPFKGDSSSLQSWYPSLKVQEAEVCDPQYPQCINPMRAGIRLADRVHAVSPNYAQEIQLPSDPSRLKFGGEGLEKDLKAAQEQHRLVGILNGCDYSATQQKRCSKAQLGSLMQQALIGWMGEQASLPACHWLADKRIDAWLNKKERGLVLTSVGRLTSQKVALMSQPLEWEGQVHSALEQLMVRLPENVVLIVLGSGDPELTLFIQKVSAQYSNLIFLAGYSETMAEALYVSGDLFLMPSSFEPCGISQMLAMRAGQPCVVHGVGGLKDTVSPGRNGFVFEGENGREQATQWIELTLTAVRMAKEEPKSFKAIRQAAKAERFEWSTVAKHYLDQLYVSPATQVTQ